MNHSQKPLLPQVYTRINILKAFQNSHLQHTKRCITFPHNVTCTQYR